MLGRYGQLLQLIDIFQPQSIVEIGTWSGDNAIRMIQRAQKYHPFIQYIGYDLFEEASVETDALELNVKPHHKVADVSARINSACSKAEINLIKGNTRQTLRRVSADLVFLDGGHSVETIRSDYENLKDSSVIVLDDFYVPDELGGCPDTAMFGCNRLVAGLKNYQVLPASDPVKDGGFTKFVLTLGDK